MKSHPKFNKVANTINVVPKLVKKNGKGNKQTSQKNMLTRVLLIPLTDGIGMLANAYSSFLLIAKA